ncbi:MAG: tetratricopeptide repeat protein [Arenicellales bacterium]|nr:tetratricopeptide repeat protein [Arenicellales bacterium]
MIQFARTPVALLVFSTLLVYAGCASSPKQETSEAESVTPVVTALVTDAQASRQNEEYDQAAVQLERALRIEPRNAGLWHELAQVYFEQGSFDQAIQFATKSNTLTKDSELRTKNWRLMAQAYTQLGDSDRANEAEKKSLKE